MSNIFLPYDQLDAIAKYWSDLYRHEASTDQLTMFRSKLKESLLQELNSGGYAWSYADPELGGYNRRFVCYFGYNPSQVLENALKAAGLKAGATCFPANTMMSIDPDRVYIGVDRDENVVWRSPHVLTQQ